MLRRILQIQDHPHIHGEHPIGTDNAALLTGSPPYTWGALQAEFIVKGSLGITPIYMGSTQFEVIVD